VYCFKTLPRDQRVGNLPSLAGFFAYLAGLLLSNPNSTIMLNIPETIIIRNKSNLHLGETMSPRKGSPPRKSPGKSAPKNRPEFEDTDPRHFFLLKNPLVEPSQGNQPSLPLVQRLTVKKHENFRDAKGQLSHWLRDLNIKKIRQHAEQRQGQEVYLPLAVSKRHVEGKGNVQSLDFTEEAAYYRLKLQFAKGHDVVMQRYLPSRSNKNSIIRMVWLRAPNEKSPQSLNMGGYFKMYQLSANRQYDGQISQEKYSPKKPQDPLKKLSQ
jgi:hypothetical protein